MPIDRTPILPNQIWKEEEKYGFLPQKMKALMIIIKNYQLSQMSKLKIHKNLRKMMTKLRNCLIH